MTGLRAAVAHSPPSGGFAFRFPVQPRSHFAPGFVGRTLLRAGVPAVPCQHPWQLRGESSRVFSRAPSDRNMVAVPRALFFCCVVGPALGQSPWQAGEPMVVTVDYDVPTLGGAGARVRAAEVAGPPTSGFSAAALSSTRRLRGDAAPPADADVVLHVPDGGMGSADEAALLAEAHRGINRLKSVAARQRSREDRVLASFGVSAAPAGDAGEAVAEVEGASSRSAGAGASVAELAAEVAAGGRVARRALEHLVALTSDPSARGAIVASEAPAAAAALLKRAGTDEADRALAGSLLTLLSGMPVAAGVSSEVTGSDGRVEIVMPRPSRVYGPDAAAMRASLAASTARSRP